ncbi:MAG: hypothetical protein KGL39_10465 [Patescibacteria group bacterium]|nr:hypothetical protein [Patescibacteria group bacterium]
MSTKEDEELDIPTFRQHAIQKGMWAGGLQKMDIPNLMGAFESEAEATPDVEIAEDDDETKSVASAASGKSSTSEKATPLRLRPITNLHTPAILKIFDETIVNASDQERGCRGNKPSERVKHIVVTFDLKTGAYSVYNDGPGIPVMVHAGTSKRLGRTVHLPEALATIEFAGTNIKKAGENVKGGINGLGLKLAYVHSVRGILETVDLEKRFFSQEYRERLLHIQPATVVDLKERSAAGKLTVEQRKPHTRVSLWPAYAALGYKVNKGELDAADAADLDAWLRYRLHQVAVYVGTNATVTYNGQLCRTNKLEAFAKLYCTQFDDASGTLIKVLDAKAKEEPYKAHPWKVAIIAFQPGIKGVRKAQNIGIVNGVNSLKGPHITYFRELLSEVVTEKVTAAMKAGKDKKKGAEKRPGPAELLADTRVICVGPLPKADWGGQNKEKLEVPKAVMKNYEIPRARLKEIAETVTLRALSALGVKSTKLGHIDKYTKAHKAGTAQAAQCALLVAEGDSAITMLKKGLSQNKSAKRPANAPPGYLVPSNDYCGFISLGGVVMNAIKETKELETADGETVLVRSEKLRNNVKLKGLVQAMGLDFAKRYDTPEERATLRYGRLFACVDQDVDGVGKILSLLLVYIYQFWPNLIKHGCIGRFLTPVIRMEPKNARGELKEFAYEEEARRFMEENPDWEKTHKEPKYFKGLAGHQAKHVKSMFEPAAFNANLYTFTLADADRELFELYFGGGKDGPAKRRNALRTPVTYLTYEEALQLKNSRLIPCAMHHQIDTKLFKLTAIGRQIPNIYDGLIPARRKVVDGAIDIFGKSGAAMKVFQLGGNIAASRFYHHGDASLNETIIRMAQSFRNARLYPLLIGFGEFGSRHLAGKDPGQPRYIDVGLSPLARIVHDPADRWLLKFVVEDGQMAEPTFFVPPVPLAILENGGSRPSEGWMHNSYGRDYGKVRDVLDALLGGHAGLTAAAERLIAEGPTAEVMGAIRLLEARYPLPVQTRGFGGRVVLYKGEPHSFGNYHYDEKTRTITVTELPHGVPTGGDSKVCKGFIGTLHDLEGKKGVWRDEYIEGPPRDDSANDDVDVRIKLRAGAYERIVEKFGNHIVDPIEEFLGLYETLKPNLNFTGPDGTVLEFGSSYLAALLYWFPARRDLYRRRLERERLLLELRVVEQENILSYCRVYDTLGLKKLDEEKATQVLANKGFAALDSRLLHSPGFTPPETLRTLIVEGPKISYDYLLELNDRNKLATSVKKRAEQLEKLREELAAAQAALDEKPFAGVTQWRADIAEFEKAVARGIATDWTFESAAARRRG